MAELEHSCLLNMAALGIQLAEYSDARRFAQEAVNLDPEFGRGWHILGMANRHLGHHEAAVKELRTAVLLCPNEASFQARLDDAIKAQKLEAQKAQERLANQKCDAAAEAWQSGKNAEAIKLWQSALVEYGELRQPLAEAGVHRRLGEVYRHLVGQAATEGDQKRQAQKSLQHAEAASSALRRADSREVTAGQEAFLTLDVARSLFLAGQNAKARRKLDEASGLARGSLGIPRDTWPYSL